MAMLLLGAAPIAHAANAAPTVATAAASTPNPVTGTTAALSVLGADDGGEPALTYTWATTGTPPAAVTISANGTNASKASTATFTKAGSYTLQCTITDTGALSVTSSVVVTVNPTLTTIAVTPSPSSVTANATLTLSATAKDQFATALTTQPTFTWTASGGGTITSAGVFTAQSTAGGPFTITAASGGKSGTSSLTVVSPGVLPVKINYQINTAAIPSGYLMDDGSVFADRGNGWSYGWSMVQSDDSRKRGVNADERLDTLNQFKVGSKWEIALPNGFYTVLVTVGDPSNASTYILNVEGVNYWNGTALAANVFASMTKTVAVSDGRLTLDQGAGTDKQTRIDYIEIYANAAPTVANAAAASPTPVTGTTAALSVVGADDGGEPALTYTWATTGTPPAAVAFSANGTNASKASTATFTKAGSYTLQCTIKDAGSLTATSSVAVTVSQTVTTITVAPATASVATSATKTFAATAADQFAAALTTQPTFTWTVSGGGTISTAGLFTAGTTAGGPFTVTAASGGKSGTAAVTVTGGNAAPTVATAAAASPNPITGTTTALSVLGADDGGEPALTYTWATTGTPPATVAFSANGTNAAKASTATFTKAGSYTLQCTIKDVPGLTVTSSVIVTVNQTLTTITVAPASASVATNGTKTFTATATDQFAAALTTQPTVTWTVSGGGTISTAGLFTAGTTAGGPFTVTAASGGKSGTASVTVTANAAPTVATAAAASPNPVTGTTAALSVLGADDGGEPALTYAWATTGTPPAAVTFSANGTNASKASTATFTKAGSYSLQCTITDAGALSVTSSVTVTVSQTLTTIAVAPAATSVALSGTKTFTATAADQFAAALTTQPTFTWTVSGGGTISAAGLFTAGTTAGGPFTVTAASGGKSGTATITVTNGNAAPTVATAAAATPNPVTGTTAALSVLGADDGGEPALIYTWATTGTPPAAVTFSANGTNASKASTATFTKAGSYTLQCTITDTGALSVTSSVAVTVNQTLTTIAVAPSPSSVTANATLTLSATAKDQFAAALTTQPTFSWTASGGGTITGAGVFTAGSTAGGPFTITAASGGKSGTSSLTVVSPGVLPVKINYQPTASVIPAGYLMDDGSVFADRGNGWSYGWSIIQSDYSRQRGVNADERLDTLNQFKVGSKWEIALPNGFYTVLVTVGDPSNASTYILNVEGVNYWNGTALAANVFATKTLTVSVSDGRLTVDQGAGTDKQTRINYVEIYANAAPTIPTAVAVTPNPVTGTTAALSVLGADDGGEPALTYTWATTGTPPAAVLFSANGTNAAKASTATFSKAGSYTIQCTVADIGGLTATSSATVTVNQTLTTITVAPASVSVATNGTSTFTAAATDQFGASLSTQPTMTWTVSGGGAISAAGLFTAGTTAGGPFTVTAASGGKSGTAAVTVTSGNAAPTVATAAAASPNPVTGTTAALSVLGADDGGEPGLTYTWATTGTPPATVAFSANGTNAAKASTATFTKAGSYVLQCTIKDAGNLTVISSVTVTVNQTLTAIAVSPASASVATSATTSFAASAKDQFGTALSTQPTMTWTVSGGGTISAAGLFTAGTTAGGPFTVTAASGGKSGTATVTVTSSNAAPTVATAAAASPNPVTGTTTALSVLGADDGGEPALTYTWATTGTPPATVAFSANGTNASKASTATFTKAGSYSLQCTIKDVPGLTVISSVTVTVNQTLTTIAVAPTSASVSTSATKAFTATAADQFGTALSAQPTFTWTLSGGGTISTAGLFTAGTTAGGPFTVTAASGGKSGTAAVTVTSANAAPTVATAAAANPNPATGTTTALSVLGADDGGEANLTYTWATTGTPPATVTFSANGTNASKASTATFTKAGTYALMATITDAGGLVATSSVTVTVNQLQTSVVISPISAVVALNGRQAFTAIVEDQFGAAVSPQPFATWGVSGGGTMDFLGTFTAGSTTGGPFTVTATFGASSGTASVLVSNGNAAPTVATAAAANPNPVTGTTAALSVLGADDGGEPALTYTWATSGKPPAAVTFSANGTNAAKASTATFTKLGSYALQCTIADTGGLTVISNVSVTVAQTFTAIAVSPTPIRVNPAQAQQFTATANDQFAAPLAAQPTFTWSATGGTISGGGLFTSGSVTGLFAVTAISGAKSGTAAVTVNAAPTIATAAMATPNPVGGTTAALSVLGADDGGESNLTYAWATTGTPPATVTFSANGTNAAKASTATFSKTGSYTIQCTIADSGSRTVTSSAVVTVIPTLTSIAVSPADNAVVINGTSAYSASGLDQFGIALTTQPSFTWSVSGGGAIAATGVFTAGTTAGGPYAVTAANGGTTGSATVTVLSAAPPTVITAAAAAPNPVNGTTTAVSVQATDPAGAATLTYTWTGTGPSVVLFSPNGTNSASSATATFAAAGTYSLHCLIANATGQSVTSSVSVVVNAVPTRMAITPASASVSPGTTIHLGAQILDQFSNPLFAQPTIAFSSTGGIAMTGNAFSPTVAAVGSQIVTASGGGMTGTAAITVMPLPVLVTQASANPAIVTGTTTALSVACANDDGNPQIEYFWYQPINATWAAPVAFSSDGTNAAKNTIATFTAPGTYTIGVVVQVGSQEPCVSQVTVVVNSTAASIQISPGTFFAQPGQAQQFAAIALDQFSTVMTNQPPFTWGVGTGGNITAQGLYTAGSAPGGPFQVTVAAGSSTANATVYVGSLPQVVAAAAASPSPVTGTTAQLSVLGTDVEGEANLSYAWSLTGTPPAPVAYSSNGNNVAKHTTATFAKSGSYSFLVTITDLALASTTSSVTVVVSATPSSVAVTPTAAALAAAGTQQFSANVLDQFGLALSSQPTRTWSTSGGGTISSSGLFTAGSTAGGPWTITATGDSISGTAMVAVGTARTQPSISFGISAYTVSEAIGTLTVPVVLSGAYVLPVTVSVGMDGNAPIPAEALPLPSTITIPPGQTTGALAVQIVDNHLGKPDAILALNLFKPVNAKLGSADVCTIQILDDNRLTMTAITPPVASGSGLQVTLAATVACANPGEVVYAWSAVDSNGITTDAVFGPTVLVAGGVTGTVLCANPIPYTCTLQATYRGQTETVQWVVNPSAGNLPGGITIAGAQQEINEVAILGSSTTASVTPVFPSNATSESIQWSSSGTIKIGANGTATTTISALTPVQFEDVFCTAGNGQASATVEFTSVIIRLPLGVTPNASNPQIVTLSANAQAVGTPWNGNVNAITSYSWSALSETGSGSATFSINNSLQAQAPQATFSAPGAYYISCSVTSSDGYGWSEGQFISVGTSLYFDQIPASSHIANAPMTQLTAHATGAPAGTTTTYTWSLISGPGTMSVGDNGTATAASTAAWFSVPGGYSVLCTAQAGSQSLSFPVGGYMNGFEIDSSMTVTQPATFTGTSLLGPTVPLSMQAEAFGGGANIIYTWSMTSGPGTATFSQNGSNNASSTQATVSIPGSYAFKCSASLHGNQTVSSSITLAIVGIVIDQPAAAYPGTLTPPLTSTALHMHAVGWGGATAGVQYTWSNAGGPAAVVFASNGTNAAQWTDGTFSYGGTDLIQCTASYLGYSATSSVTVIDTQVLSFTVPPTAAKITGLALPLNVQAAEPGVSASSLVYTWTMLSGPAPISFSANGTNAAQSSIATATQYGSYEFRCTVSDPSGNMIQAYISAEYDNLAWATLPTASENVAASANGPLIYNLSALAATGAGSDAGVIYTWSLIQGAGPAAFTANGSNAAKASEISLVNCGSYFVTCTAAYAGLTITANLTFTDNTLVFTTSPVGSNSPITTPTTNYTALAAEQGLASSSITYTWSCPSNPSAVTMTPNGTNSAQNVQATFSADGAFPLICTATDPLGRKAIATCTTYVNALLWTRLPMAAINANQTSITFSALAHDPLANDAQIIYQWYIGDGPQISFGANNSNQAQLSMGTPFHGGTSTVICAAQVDGVSITQYIQVTITAGPIVGFAISPSGARLIGGSTQQYTAIGVDRFGDPAVGTVSPVSWTINGGGTMTAAGLFTAGSASGVFNVTGTNSQASNSTTVTILNLATSSPTQGLTASIVDRTAGGSPALPGTVWSGGVGGAVHLQAVTPRLTIRHRYMEACMKLTVQAVPGAQVIFVCTGEGTFPTGTGNLITAVADNSGIATVQFLPGLHQTTEVLAGSSSCSGRVRFIVVPE